MCQVITHQLPVSKSALTSADIKQQHLFPPALCARDLGGLTRGPLGAGGHFWASAKTCGLLSARGRHPQGTGPRLCTPRASKSSDPGQTLCCLWRSRIRRGRTSLSAPSLTASHRPIPNSRAGETDSTFDGEAAKAWRRGVGREDLQTRLQLFL